MDYTIQKAFIAAYTDEHVADFNSSRKRKMSRAYYLPYCGQRKRVCSDFFSRTLDVGIRGIQKCLEKRHEIGNIISSFSDGRGKHIEIK